MYDDWPTCHHEIPVAEAVLIVGRKLVAAIDDLRTELARSAGGLNQVGTDLVELLERIAANAAAGDPVQADVDAARALADGLVSTGASIDAILAPAPEPEPEPVPEV